MQAGNVEILLHLGRAFGKAIVSTLGEADHILTEPIALGGVATKSRNISVCGCCSLWLLANYYKKSQKLEMNREYPEMWGLTEVKAAPLCHRHSRRSACGSEPFSKATQEAQHRTQSQSKVR